MNAGAIENTYRKGIIWRFLALKLIIPRLLTQRVKKIIHARMIRLACPRREKSPKRRHTTAIRLNRKVLLPFL